MKRLSSCGKTLLPWAVSLFILMALGAGCGLLDPDDHQVGFRVQGPPGSRAWISYTAPGTWGRANVDLPFFADIGAVPEGERVTLTVRGSTWVAAIILVDGEVWKEAAGQNVSTGGKVE